MRISKHVLAKNSKFETPYYIIDGELQGSTVMKRQVFTGQNGQAFSLRKSC